MYFLCPNCVWTPVLDLKLGQSLSQLDKVANLDSKLGQSLSRLDKLCNLDLELGQSFSRLDKVCNLDKVSHASHVARHGLGTESTPFEWFRPH